jgi:hypothetical protein
MERICVRSGAAGGRVGWTAGGIPSMVVVTQL